MRTLAIFLLGLAIGVGGTVTFRQVEGGGRPGSTDGPPSDGDEGPEISQTAPGLRERQSIVALGTLEPRDGIVQISSPLVGYHVKEVLARDGQLVKPGTVLVELDASSANAEHELAGSQLSEAVDRQQTEISLAKQRIASAQLAVQQAAEGRELELAVQRSRIAVAGAKEKQAAKDGARLEELSKLPEPLASQQQVEGQRLLMEGAAAEREGAQLALKRLEQSLTFQQQTAAAELRAAEQSLVVAEKGTGVESLRRRVELAKLKLEETTILAPAGGVILGVTVHPGEVVSQQPLLQIADLDNLICDVEVAAADVMYLQPHNKALVSCRAFQGAVLEGTIDRVGNPVSQATLRPLDPRRAVDRDITKVVVVIDSKKAARLINTTGNDRRSALVGLQVEVSFPLAK